MLAISAFTSLAKTPRFSFAQSVEHGHRVYTVEMHEMKTLQGMLDALSADASTGIERASARSVEVILEKLQEIVNPDAVTKVADENGETRMPPKSGIRNPPTHHRPPATVRVFS